MEDLLKEFKSNAATFVDETIKKWKYRNDKLTVRRATSTLADTEREFHNVLMAANLKLGEIKNETLLKAKENQELPKKLNHELTRQVQRFIKECAPPSADRPKK